MTLYEFNVLTDDEKANAVWSGSFLADREENGLILQLYAVSNFYVEVYYDTAANKILKLRSFSSQNQLTPYLIKIQIKP